MIGGTKLRLHLTNTQCHSCESQYCTYLNVFASSAVNEFIHQFNLGPTVGSVHHTSLCSFIFGM